MRFILRIAIVQRAHIFSYGVMQVMDVNLRQVMYSKKK